MEEQRPQTLEQVDNAQAYSQGTETRSLTIACPACPQDHDKTGKSAMCMPHLMLALRTPRSFHRCGYGPNHMRGAQTYASITYDGAKPDHFEQSQAYSTHWSQHAPEKQRGGHGAEVLKRWSRGCSRPSSADTDSGIAAKVGDQVPSERWKTLRVCSEARAMESNLATTPPSVARLCVLLEARAGGNGACT